MAEKFVSENPAVAATAAAAAAAAAGRGA